MLEQIKNNKPRMNYINNVVSKPEEQKHQNSHNITSEVPTNQDPNVEIGLGGGGQYVLEQN